MRASSSPLDTRRPRNETVTVRVEIRTSGGFTGRGIGNVSIDDARSLRALVDAALLSPEPKSTPAMTPDSITYRMTVEHGEKQRTFTWSDSAPPPAAVLALFNAAWAMRQ